MHTRGRERTHKMKDSGGGQLMYEGLTASGTRPKISVAFYEVFRIFHNTILHPSSHPS